jgi:hypothetical protein
VVRGTKERFDDLGPPHEKDMKIRGGSQQRPGDYLVRSVVAPLGIESQCDGALLSHRGCTGVQPGVSFVEDMEADTKNVSYAAAYGKRAKVSKMLVFWPAPTYNEVGRDLMRD